MARTYDTALKHLSSLQSNRAITSLFTPPAPPPPSSSIPQSANKPQDLNALAIPEMLAWLSRAGYSPADLSRLKCIHVAGTKGKGSVCAYLTSILTQPGLREVAGRVGTYTSPHLISVRERIMLDGRPISQELFARYFFEVWDALTASARAEYLLLQRQKRNPGLAADHGDDDRGQQMDDARVEAELEGPATKPFYFRFLTIMAFHVFLREGVRSAVVECGIGGEYDSTNVLGADAVTASVVTQLGIDHVALLGAKLSDIAWHKIGVAKAGKTCFTRKLVGETGEMAMEVMRQRVLKIGAKLCEVADGEVEKWGGVQPDAAGGLGGAFQIYNQALAAAAAREHLRALGAPLDLSEPIFDRLPDDFKQGLQQARLRGRCELIKDGNITWLIDGAHTAESLQEAAKWFASQVKIHGDARKVLIFNQQDRDASKLVQVLCEGVKDSGSSANNVFDKAIFARNEDAKRTEGEPERDLSVQKSAADSFERLYTGKKPTVVDNVYDAIAEAKKADPQSETLVLVTGSLHLVGAVLRLLEPDALI